MNKIYRVIWNEITRTFVAVAENVKGRGKSASSTVGGGSIASFVLRPLALTLASIGLAQAAIPAATQLPTSGQVVAGTAAISQSGATLNINQSTQNAAINWQSFNIGSAATVNFIQPSSSSVALNRVLGSDPSQIFGHLNSNGQVFLSNPNGAYFAPGASVNVGALVATTGSISNADFMAGNYTFSNAGGSIVNDGKLTAALGGYIALLAPEVRNNGVIIAQMGTVALAAGEAYTLQFDNNSLTNIIVQPSAIAALIENGNAIHAPGGLIILSAQAASSLQGGVVNNSGAIEANGLVNNGGTIRLLASDTINQTGSITADGTGTGNGGRVSLIANLAHANSVTNVAGSISARGGNAGGNGGQVETSAAHVHVANTARIDTRAPLGLTGSWLLDPDGFTIAAVGGDITGAELTTELGLTNVSIASTSGTGSDGNINVNDNIAWYANKLTLTATNDININAVLTAGANSVSSFASLDLEAGSGNVNIGFNQNISLGKYGSSGLSKGQVNFLQADGITARTGGGFLTMNTHAYTVIGDDTTAAGIAALQGINTSIDTLAGYYALGGNVDASSAANFTPIGTSTTPFTGVLDGLGHTVNSLTINLPTTDNVGLVGYGSAAVIRNIGLTNVNVTGKNNTGALVGTNLNSQISNSFVTGHVTGVNNVGGLAGFNYANGAAAGINDSFNSASVHGVNNVGGLVGENYGKNATADISNSSSSGTVLSTASNVGGLVGLNSGSNGTAQISNSYAIGSVEGINNIGGLVGQNYGDNATASIVNSYASGAVGNNNDTGDNVGGLVGDNYATNFGTASIDNSYATGTVRGSNSVGGLVGYNYANNGTVGISNSYATGSVQSLGTSSNAGGLVGYNYADTGTAQISNSYATGTVSGYNDVGGLVGQNYASCGTAQISNSYAIGAVTGADYVGGLAGYNHTNSSNINVASISNSFATGKVSGNSFVGGLIGMNYGYTTSISNVFATGAVTGTTDVGGLVGDNTSNNYSGSASIVTAYATGAVNGTSNVGGLVGHNGSTASILNAYASGAVSGTSNVDALVGYNEGAVTNVTAGLPVLTNNTWRGAASGGDWTDAGNWLLGHAPTVLETAVLASNSVDIPVNVLAGDVTTTTGATLNFTGTTVSSLSLGGKAAVTLGTSANDVSISYGSSGKLNLPTATTIDYNGVTYTVINQLGLENSITGSDLQGINGNLGGLYVLGLDIDASAISYWTNDFTPIGSSAYAFSGVLDGLGHAVNNLTINTTGDVGLVGYNTGTIRNIGVTNASVSGVGNVGALAGYNAGTISHSYSTGIVYGMSAGVAAGVGGLAGYNNGAISDSYSSAFVVGAFAANAGNQGAGGLVGYNGTSGQINNSHANGLTLGIFKYGLSNNLGAGGLVGNNAGSITGSYASDTVLARDISQGSSPVLSFASGSYGIGVGGLAGVNASSANITDSYATGNITADFTSGGPRPENGGAGGLVGYNNGSIATSHATGMLGGKYGGDNQGGLVGINNGSISYSYATGAVSGASYQGGLTGNNNGSIDHAYASGAVFGTNSVGGLVGGKYGSNNPNLVISDSVASGSVTGDSNVGGLIGSSSYTTISSSHAAGRVSGTSNVGGLVGYLSGGYNLVNGDTASITGSYATGNVSGSTEVNGLIGYSNAVIPNISNSYYNIDTVLINGEHRSGLGGIYNTQYSAWMTGSQTALVASDYLTAVAGVYQLSTTTDLQNMLAFVYTPGLQFKLTGNIDVGSLSNWYIPLLIGATFDGGSHTLSNLNINTDISAPVNSRLGLIGAMVSSNVHDLTLLNPQVSGSNDLGALAGIVANPGTATDMTDGSTINHITVAGSGTITSSNGSDVGGLAGYISDNTATLGNSTAAVTVNAANSINVGGLIGRNDGSVSDSSATGAVTGFENVGGLVGKNGYLNVAADSISNSFATGAVTGSYKNTGGLIGANYGSVVDSHATGAVTGDHNTGGLVGFNYGYNNSVSISNSYATGDVSGNNNIGGLVGQNSSNYGSTVSISSSYATGAVSGNNNVGGLVGQNEGVWSGTASISNSYATGAVTGTGNTGGLVGQNYGNGGTASISSSYATGVVTGSFSYGYTGGLVGENFANNSGTASINASYATGAVTGSGNTGGLVGTNYAYNTSTASISDTYATGVVTGSGNYSETGGLLGVNYADGTSTASINNSFAANTSVNGTGTNAQTGALVGLNTGGAVTQSFYDHTLLASLSGFGDSTPDSIGVVEAKSTTELQQEALFNTAGWNIVVDNNLPAGYARLAFTEGVNAPEGYTWVIGTTPAPANATTPPPPPAPPVKPLPTPQTAPPQLMTTPGSSAGIVVNLQAPPAGSQPGVINVTVPKSLSSSGSSLLFTLPAQVSQTAGNAPVIATLANGVTLPSWISFDPVTLTFTAANVPDGALPLQVTVTAGSQTFTVMITETSGQ